MFLEFGVMMNFEHLFFLSICEEMHEQVDGFWVVSRCFGQSASHPGWTTQKKISRYRASRGTISPTGLSSIQEK